MVLLLPKLRFVVLAGRGILNQSVACVRCFATCVICYYSTQYVLIVLRCSFRARKIAHGTVPGKKQKFQKSLDDLESYGND